MESTSARWDVVCRLRGLPAGGGPVSSGWWAPHCSLSAWRSRGGPRPASGPTCGGTGTGIRRPSSGHCAGAYDPAEGGSVASPIAEGVRGNDPSDGMEDVRPIVVSLLGVPAVLYLGRIGLVDCWARQYRRAHQSRTD